MAEKRIGNMRKIIVLLLSLIFLFANTEMAFARQNRIEILSDTETSRTISNFISPLCKAAGIQNKKLKLYIIIDNEINAFVTQGGNLFINTGLITAFNDPNVLEGVVAHELAHLASGHAILRRNKIDKVLQQSLLTTLLGIGAAVAGSPDLAIAVILGGQHTAERTYTKYSREQETVADTLAIKYLHATGNTARGFVTLLEHFNSKELHLSDRGISPYMLTHPLSKERLKRVREYPLQEKNNPAIHPTSQQNKEAYARIAAKLRAFFETNDYLNNIKKDLTGFAKNYGDAIAFYKKSQFKKSFASLDALIAQHPQDGYLHELKGQFLFETERVLPAVEAYKKAIHLLGDKALSKGDYAIVLMHASKLYKDPGQRKAALNEAILILNRILDIPHQRSPYIYRNLAIAYGNLGKLGHSNLMLAEEAILLQRNRDAKKFIAIAKNYAGQDTKLKLKIEDVSKFLTNKFNRQLI